VSTSSYDSRQALVWSALIVVLVVLAGGLYYYWVSSKPEPSPVEAPAATEAGPESQARPETEIRHPIAPAAPEAASREALPPLAESDGLIESALNGLIGKDAVERYFHPKEIVRRFVVTIDNLPREKIPSRYGFAKPVAGRFQAAGADENVRLSPNNYRRYAPYLRLAESVDTRRLVALYIHFYPLLQEEYQNLADPKGYFNDRVVEAIDDLLAAPEPTGPIRLVRPKVMYEFADPELEGLSAGQKIMVRMGPEQAARIKAKLREIRSELTAGR
jgi:hypothetical protein